MDKSLDDLKMELEKLEEKKSSKASYVFYSACLWVPFFLFFLYVFMTFPELNMPASEMFERFGSISEFHKARDTYQQMFNFFLTASIISAIPMVWFWNSLKTIIAEKNELEKHIGNLEKTTK